MQTATLIKPVSLHLCWPRACRGGIAMLLGIAVLFASLHHLSCLMDDDDPTSSSATVVSAEMPAAPSNDNHSLAVHCHCVCHVAPMASSAPVATPVQFIASGYAVCDDVQVRAAAAQLPFEPPRA